MNRRLLLAALLFAMPLFAADVEVAVTAAGGDPVAGATVTAHMVESSATQRTRLENRSTRVAIATATTSADGIARLTNLPDAVVDIAVKADDFTPAVARVVPSAIPVGITVRAADMKEGRVIARGKAVADATVVWIGMNDAEYATTTDANGRYKTPDPSHWAHQFFAFHRSFHATSGYRGEGLQIEMQPGSATAAQRGTASLSGTVRVGKKPLAGAPVMIQQNDEEGTPPIRVVTDAKGNYAIDGLLPRRTMVFPGEGLAPRFRMENVARIDEGGREPQFADLTTERSATVDINLVAAPLISGRVTDAEGKPRAGSQVQVILPGRSAFDFLHEPFARTTADGRYAISAPPFGAAELAQVAVSSRDHSTVRSKPFPIGSEDHRIDITLPKFEVVTVRVLDAEKKPLPQARVAFAGTEELSSYRDPAMLLMPMFEARTLKTNAAGEATLHLAAGAYDFAATAPGHQVRTISERSIARATTIDLQLERAVAIQGRLHRNGAGVANVNVMVAGERVRRDQPIVTSGDGTFVIDGLAPGKYRLELFDHQRMINKTLEAEAPSKVDVALPAAGTLRGRVIDTATRLPVTEFAYSIEPLDSSDEGNPDRMRGMQRGTNSGDGMFVAEVPVGRYRVSAGAQGYTPSRPVEVVVKQNEPADAEVTLDRGVVLTGRVTDESGTPLAGASVFAVDAEPETRRSRMTTRTGPSSAQTAADGSFTLSGLTPGSIVITARKDGFVPFRKVLETDTATSLDIQLGRGLTIEGVVVRGGKPVAGAQVGATTSALGGDHQPATTDRNGRFTLAGLIPARYSVSAFIEEAHTEVKDVDPASKKELVISLDPKPTGILFGTVTGLPQNLGGKIVRRGVFVQSDDRGAEATIDDSGNYRVENAPTGNVFITAQVESPSGSRSSQRKQVTLAAGQSVRVDLDLGGTITVRGRVTAEGKPVGGARVVFAMESGLAASATSREDGNYEVSLAGSGTYQIFAHIESVMPRSYQTLREIRGSETFDIDFREQIIEGTVVDAETRLPLEGALVTLTAEGAPSHMVAGETIADANGRFRITTAASGPHRVIAWSRGYAHRVQPIQLGSSRPSQLSFELSRTGDLRVRVIDAKNGTPLEAHVVLESIAGGYLPLRPQRLPDGSAYVFSAAPGRYRLTAIAHGYANKVLEVEAPGSVDVPME